MHRRLKQLMSCLLRLVYLSLSQELFTILIGNECFYWGSAYLYYRSTVVITWLILDFVQLVYMCHELRLIELNSRFQYFRILMICFFNCHTCLIRILISVFCTVLCTKRGPSPTLIVPVSGLSTLC